MDFLKIKKYLFIPFCISSGFGIILLEKPFNFFIGLLVFILYYIYAEDLKEIELQRNYIFTLSDIFKIKYIGDNLYYKFRSTENNIIDNVIIETKSFKKIGINDLIKIFNDLNPLMHFNLCNNYDIFLVELNEISITLLKGILKDYYNYEKVNIIYLKDIKLLNIYPLINEILKININNLVYTKII